MILRNPAWIALIGGYLVAASGVLDVAGKTLSGIDQSINAAIDLRKVVPPLIKPQPKMPVKAKPKQ